MNAKESNNRIVQKNDTLLAEKTRECPECGSTILITNPEHAEIYCADCGVVIEENIVDQGPEWRAFDTEQQLKRTRAEPTGDELGTPYKRIPGLKQYGRRQVGNVTPPNQKTLRRAFQEVNRFCVDIGLPKEIEREAIELCRKAQKENLFKSVGVERVSAAIVLITCRVNNIPITVEEICDKTFFVKKEIITASRTIKKRFGIRKTANSDPCIFLPKFCSELGLNKQVENLSKEIIEIAKAQNLFNGKRPSDVAAAAIFIAGTKIGNNIEINKEMRRISKIFGITGETINKRIDEFIGNESILSYLDKM